MLLQKGEISETGIEKIKEMKKIFCNFTTSWSVKTIGGLEKGKKIYNLWEVSLGLSAPAGLCFAYSRLIG